MMYLPIFSLKADLWSLIQLFTYFALSSSLVFLFFLRVQYCPQGSLLFKFNLSMVLMDGILFLECGDISCPPIGHSSVLNQ